MLGPVEELIAGLTAPTSVLDRPRLEDAVWAKIPREHRRSVAQLRLVRCRLEDEEMPSWVNVEAVPVDSLVAIGRTLGLAADGSRRASL